MRGLTHWLAWGHCALWVFGVCLTMSSSAVRATDLSVSSLDSDPNIDFGTKDKSYNGNTTEDEQQTALMTDMSSDISLEHHREHSPRKAFSAIKPLAVFVGLALGIFLMLLVYVANAIGRKIGVVLVSLELDESPESEKAKTEVGKKKEELADLEDKVGQRKDTPESRGTSMDHQKDFVSVEDMQAIPAKDGAQPTLISALSDQPKQPPVDMKIPKSEVKFGDNYLASRKEKAALWPMSVPMTSPRDMPDLKMAEQERPKSQQSRAQEKGMEDIAKDILTRKPGSVKSQRRWSQAPGNDLLALNDMQFSQPQEFSIPITDALKIKQSAPLLGDSSGSNTEPVATLEQALGARKKVATPEAPMPAPPLSRNLSLLPRGAFEPEPPKRVADTTGSLDGNTDESTDSETDNDEIEDIPVQPKRDPVEGDNEKKKRRSVSFGPSVVVTLDDIDISAASSRRAAIEDNKKRIRGQNSGRPKSILSRPRSIIKNDSNASNSSTLVPTGNKKASFSSLGSPFSSSTGAPMATPGASSFGDASSSSTASSPAVTPTAPKRTPILKPATFKFDVPNAQPGKSPTVSRFSFEQGNNGSPFSIVKKTEQVKPEEDS